MMKGLMRFFSRLEFHKLWKNLRHGKGLPYPAIAVGLVIGAIAYAIKVGVEEE